MGPYNSISDPNGIRVENTIRGMHIHFLCHRELRQVFFLYVYYTTEMCTAFGINYYIQKNKHSHAVLQNGIFEQLYIILPIDYNNMTLIAALNINQSTNRVEDLG